MSGIEIIIVICWAAFWAYWLFTARSAKSSQPLSSRFVGVRLAVIVVAIFLARALGLHSHTAGGDLALTGIGMALLVLGLAFALWARIYIGRNWGMPMTRREEPELVTTGPYRRVRHPIYSGIIGAMTGTALATNVYWLIVVAALAGYFVYTATREESFLAGQFPETYPAYKRSTKMLVPFVF